MTINSGEIGTLLADMIFNDATGEEIEDVIRYSAAVINVERLGKKIDIEALKKKYLVHGDRK